jgi:hypothetical protein
MKKILMLLVPVFCFGLFAIGCAPEPAKKPTDKAPAVSKEAPKDAPAPKTDDKK